MTSQEKARARSLRWYHAHREEILARQREHRRQNPDRVRAQEKARRGRRRCSGNRLLVMERDGHRCRDCGTTQGLMVHHLDGRGRQGRVLRHLPRNDDPSNLIALCGSCHNRRHEHDGSQVGMERQRRKREGINRMGPERLSARNRKVAQVLGPEGRSARMRKAWERLSPEQRASRVRRAAESSWGGLDPESRKRRLQKAWATRRQREMGTNGQVGAGNDTAT